MINCAVVFIIFTVLTSSGYSQDTVQVKTGWNIIGSLEAAIAPESLVTEPADIITSSMYGYNPGAGYDAAPSLEKGKGYWVKVSADGVVIFNMSSSAECGIRRVDYGGISYGTVQIGDQCWLAENLNVGTMLTEYGNQTDNGTLEKSCYGNNSVYCGVYGGLYQWNEAMQYDTTGGGQGICPSGWHIPTYAEFQTLSATVGANGNALKEGSVGINPGGLGTNTSGFSALLAGAQLPNGDGEPVGIYTAFWSSTEYGATTASILGLHPSSSQVDLTTDGKVVGFSVRCLED